MFMERFMNGVKGSQGTPAIDLPPGIAIAEFQNISVGRRHEAQKEFVSRHVQTLAVAASELTCFGS